MRSLISFFIFSICISSFASDFLQDLKAGKLKTVKVADSLSITCHSEEDYNRGKLGAYIGKAIDVQVSETHLTAKLELTFLKCQKNDGNFSFAPRKPYDKLSYSNFNGEQTLDVEVEPSKVELMGIIDGESNLLFKLLLENKAHQQVMVSVPLEQLYKIQYYDIHKGNESNLFFDFWVASLSEVHVAERPDYHDQMRTTYGSFRILLDNHL